MKKITSAILALLLAASMTACGEKAVDTMEEVTAQTTAAETEKATEAVTTEDKQEETEAETATEAETTTAPDNAELLKCFEYKVLDDGTLTIKDYNGRYDKLEIPSEIDGRIVTVIDSAFYKESFTEVVIPNTVKSIKSAFRDCKSLTTVYIPDSVKEIGDGAFDGCAALTTVNIPKSVCSIGKAAFDDTAFYSLHKDGFL